jgi:hypothetical protein
MIEMPAAGRPALDGASAMQRGARTSKIPTLEDLRADRSARH